MSKRDWIELGVIIALVTAISGAFLIAWFHHRKQSKGDRHERNHTL